MHILLVADGRSPIARNWIQGLLALQHRLTLVSTYPCEPIAGVEQTHVLPVAFAGWSGSQVRPAAGNSASSSSTRLRKMVSGARPAFLSARYMLGPLTVPLRARQYQRLVAATKPDLVHALRIPFEGMLASYTPVAIPFIVSVWGNDLTLHASGSPWMSSLTLKTLRRANGLMADAARDIRLGHCWGFPAGHQTLVVPGGGGIDLGEIRRSHSESPLALDEPLPDGVPLVVNPRGFRPGSVRNDIFFQAIPLVLERLPGVSFVCPAMAGQSEARRWVSRLKLDKYVRLLPYLPQGQLWDLFLRSAILVSLSAHDGTPNSLLEAMSCGCFPIAGDIESLREWITPGVNGLLVEPEKPQALAEALLIALSQPRLRSAAAEINLKLIESRAEINLVRAQLQVFYQRFF
jgi:glycosyltransferase involved in cell wall biosynthesis